MERCEIEGVRCMVVGGVGTIERNLFHMLDDKRVFLQA